MRKTLKAFTYLLLLALLLGGVYFFGVKVPSVDNKMNPVTPHDPYKVSPATQKFHDTLMIADLHGDALLWRRNPEHRQARGHMDIPRLREGGVDIQIFSAVTKSPKGLNFDHNDAKAPDDITALAIAQLWPLRSWNSIYERAAFQAQRLQKLEANPKNNLKIIRRQADLVLSPAPNSNTLLALLATEGSHPLEGQIENIERLYNEGYRMMGLQHFFDNALGGSLHGKKKGGLTDFGRQAVTKMHEMDIIIDVAHSSEKTVRDVLALSKDPVIISHGGLRSHCPKTGNRNMPDDILQEIARRGGLLGIGYFSGTICDISPDGIADTIIAAVNLMGPDAVALGSDFDGTVTTALDTSELAAITQALRNRGVKDATIRKVMGENVRRFLAENLPR